MKKFTFQKIAAIVLTLVLALTMTACGSTDSQARVLTLVPEETQEINGKEMTYTIVSCSEYGDGEAFLSDGDGAVSLGYTEWGHDSYVYVPNGNEMIVYATLCFSNDWYETAPVVIHGKEMTGYPAMDGILASPEDITAADRCVLQTRESVFGTYGVKVAYTLTDKGFVEESTRHQIINEKQVDDGSYLDGLSGDNYNRSIYDSNGRRILTLKCDLPLNTENGEVTLPAGTVVWPVGIDTTEEKFYVERQDGTEGWFNYSVGSEGYGYSINGVDEADCFVTLAYAG